MRQVVRLTVVIPLLSAARSPRSSGPFAVSFTILNTVPFRTQGL